MKSSDSLSSNGSRGSSLSAKLEPVPPTGLTVLVNPSNPSVDIVFVHGFTGHPARTWTNKRPTGVQEVEDEADSTRSPRFGRFLSPSSPRTSPGSPVYWPRDLLPSAAPFARILTFGYDTNVRHRFMGRVSKNTVYDIAGDLLVSLTSARHYDASRPLVFVAHSLGGIVVKECLRRSQSHRTHQQHLSAVFGSTTGIIFFGTPHGGSDPRGFLQHVAETVIRSVGFSVNSSIVSTLLPSSERLRELRDEFGPMVRQQNWLVHSFQEQYGILALGGNKVVEDPSSCLNDPTIEVTEHIANNHMQMCRFTGHEDPEYRKFLAALDRVLEGPNRLYPIGMSMAPYSATPLDAESRMHHFEALPFPKMFVRETTVRTAHHATCGWLLSKPEYQDWLNDQSLDAHHGLMWIMGNPGTGKSTMMKYLIERARETFQNTLIATFLFNARGGELEKSAVGMYRSLIFQVLSKEPRLLSALDTLGPSINVEEENRTWELSTLESIFRAMVSRLGATRLVLFVDALDECDEDDSRSVVSVFEQLGNLVATSNLNFRLCLSSRHYPHISVQKRLLCVLEAEQDHFADIAHYLDTELRIGYGQEEGEIRQELLHRSRGTFLWVVLATSSLNKAYDHGHTNELRSRLRKIPNELGSLFQELLIRDDGDREAMITCFKWLLTSYRPLSVTELYYGIMTARPNASLGPWDPDAISSEDMKRYLISTSKGLVEMVEEDDKTSRVQFIHESVSDFLRSESGLVALSPMLKTNLRGQCEDLLSRSCVRYLTAKDVKAIHMAEGALERDKRQWTSLVRRQLPLLDYSTRYFLHHAEEAAGWEIPQQEQLSNMMEMDNLLLARLCSQWGFWSSVVHMSKIEIMLHVCAERNLAYLLWFLKHNTDNLDVINKLYTSPMIFALRGACKTAMTEFLRPLEDWKAMRSPVDKIESTYNFAAIEPSFDFESNGQGHSRKNTITGHPTLLSWFVNNGHVDMVRVLLATEKVDVNVRHKNGKTPIVWAVQNGSEEIVQLLLETGKVDLSVVLMGQNLLMMAVERGHVGIARLLLETGAIPVNATDYQWCTALFYATRQDGSAGVVRLLLNVSDIQVNACDLSGATPLFHAVLNGNKDVVQALLNGRDVDVNHKNSLGDTVLMTAAINYHTQKVEMGKMIRMMHMLLQDPRLNINAKDSRGRALLSLAVEYHIPGLIRRLIETQGLDVNSQDCQGQTALHVAVATNQAETVQILMGARGINIDIKDNWGRSALYQEGISE